MQKRGNLVGWRCAFALQADVGEHPVVTLRHALERQVQRMAHRAVRAVAADQPRGKHRLRDPVIVPQPRLHMRRRLAERGQLHLAFHRDTKRLELRE